MTVSFKFGVVPQSFNDGILVPILKKPTLDPTCAKNYRPVILSSIFSKLSEMFILHENSDVSLSDYQFGFVEGRGTSMAASLAHDVGVHCTQNGSQMYTCSLDAEGAFDAIPHPVLFYKSMNVLSDMSWRFLYSWYACIKVKIKWEGFLSNDIDIQKGTRQGGLSSPFLFNIFYMELIDVLSEHDGGISIDQFKYNVFCYADDILLASTTVSGLQALINTAVNHITKHGLRFNPSKTECYIKGINPFIVKPKWYISNTLLTNKDFISYLGITLTDKASDNHVDSRLKSCRKAFYSLQNAGLCKNGLNIDTSMHVWSTICQSTLSYGCEAVSLWKQNVRDLDKLQGKLVKCLIGIGWTYRSTPLLKALSIKKMNNIVFMQNINLLRNILKNSSAARNLNLYFINNNKNMPGTLYSRVKNISDDFHINFHNTIFTDSNLNKYFHIIPKSGEDGLVDSLRGLLLPTVRDREMIKLLLRSF